MYTISISISIHSSISTRSGSFLGRLNVSLISQSVSLSHLYSIYCLSVRIPSQPTPSTYLLPPTLLYTYLCFPSFPSLLPPLRSSTISLPDAASANQLHSPFGLRVGWRRVSALGSGCEDQGVGLGLVASWCVSCSRNVCSWGG